MVPIMNKGATIRANGATKRRPLTFSLDGRGESFSRLRCCVRETGTMVAWLLQHGERLAMARDFVDPLRAYDSP